MDTVFFDPTLTDEQRRRALYAGRVLVFPPRPSTQALCEVARELAEASFAPLDPPTAHFSLAPRAFGAIVERYAPTFATHPRTRAGIRAILEDFGCDLQATYYAAPQARASTSHGYHAAAQTDSYLPHMPPHRDTWYSGIQCAINWWLPVYDLALDNGLAFHPRYWARAVPDGKGRFRRSLRAGAADPADPLPDLHQQLRLVCPAGGVVMFSGAQLHSSVPNMSGRTRFSFDFRTVHLADVQAARGAPNVDDVAFPAASVLKLFRRADDGAGFPAEVAARYEARAATPENGGAVSFDGLLAALRARGRD